MQLLFKQRAFSWFDSYDVYDEYGNVVYHVKGQFSLKRRLNIYDAEGRKVGFIQQKLFTFFPKFEIYKNDQYLGCVSRKLSFFTHKFEMDYNGWTMEGNPIGFDYRVQDINGKHIADINKELFHFTDTYVINVPDQKNALDVLMLVLAIDVEKANRNDHHAEP